MTYTMPYTIESMEDLEKLPIKISYVGETRHGDWDCFAWRVEISSAAGFWSTDYFTGRGLVTKPKHPMAPVKPKVPTNADVLYSLTRDASASDFNFADWCAEYGYSDDSIKALNAYRSCLEIGTNLRKHFGRDTVAKIADLLQEY